MNNKLEETQNKLYGVISSIVGTGNVRDIINDIVNDYIIDAMQEKFDDMTISSLNKGRFELYIDSEIDSNRETGPFVCKSFSVEDIANSFIDRYNPNSNCKNCNDFLESLDRAKLIITSKRVKK